MNSKSNIRRSKIREFVESIVGDCMHAKRVLSLSNAVEGVMYASSLALSAIGKALSTAQGLDPKHAVKQLDRFFSNSKVLLDVFFLQWVSFLLGDRTEVVVALDWTDFDKDNQSTLALNLVTKHGRATPLIWKTYEKSTLKGRRNFYEDKMLFFFKSCISQDCKVTILADRGFCDTAFLKYMDNLGFNYVVRLKNNIAMRVGDSCMPLKSWLHPSGKARLFKNVYLTAEDIPIASMVCVRGKKMKSPWFLATNLPTSLSSTIIGLYGRRFSIEENFRDVKDIRFGMGLSHVTIRKPERRDRILMASAIASSLLTILGAAGESLGFDRLLKVNTSKKRTHSLLNQGSFYFQAMVNYKDEKLLKLINRFTELLSEQKVFKDLFGLI